MAMLGSAVTIVTTDGPAGRFGFTASAVCSVTDSPPTLLVCVNRASANHEHFKTNGVLCVNVLTGGHQSTSGAFANRQLTMQERFSSVNCQTLVTGSPAIEEALVNLDCRVSKIDEVGTHSIFTVKSSNSNTAKPRKAWSISIAITTVSTTKCAWPPISNRCPDLRDCRRFLLAGSSSATGS